MPGSGHGRETFNNTQPSLDRAGLNHRIEWALLREVYARQRLTMALQIFGCLFAYAFAIKTSMARMDLWSSQLLAYGALGLFIQWVFRRKPQRSEHLRRWQSLFVSQCMLSGFAWTYVLTTELPNASGSGVSVTVAILLGGSAVSLGVLSPQRFATAAFSCFAILPPALVLFKSDNPDLNFVATAMVLCLIAIVAVGNELHNSLRRQLQAQFALEEALQEADRAREQAESASKAKSQFLATMSHELRTPMNGVLGMLQLVRETSINQQQRDYLDKMNGAATSLLTLLNDVLDFSKIEAGSLKAHHRYFRIDALMRNLADILSGNVERDAVAVQFQIDPQTPDTLVGDEQLIQQVMVNLAGNALKFTTQGFVHVSLQVLEQEAGSVQLRFSVKDTGVGIAAEHLEVIFDAFAQAESSTTRRFGGTGLGLSISKNLVELMGGALQVESEPGKGSTFWFDLNLDIAQAPLQYRNSALADLTTPPTTRTPRLQGLRILLAEDNLLNQQIACELLALEGATVRAVGDGQQAVDVLAALAPDLPLEYDLVLMDMHMPMLDGMDATRRIRQLAHLQSLPILAMTANAMVQDKQACLDAGMNGHIGKPFTIDLLVRAIQAQLPAAP